jgi:2-iminobutanoate/2-iminopropanoate deaminase
MRRVAILLLLAACVAPSEHLAAPGLLGPYSSGVVSGEQVWLSGKIGAAETRSGPFAAEVDSALDAVQADLSRLGLGWPDVAAVTIHLTDLNLYGTLNDVYARRLAAPYPARTCVGVTALPGGARVEITVVARR